MFMTPSIGIKGTFKLASPFNTLLNPKQEYTVTSMRNIVEMNNAGEDVYKYIYEPLGLERSTYETDIQQNVPIITVATTGDDYYSFPGKYLESMPSNNGVRYQNKTIAVDLGSIPVDTDLSALQDAISVAVVERFKITPRVETLKTGAVVYVSYTEHLELERLKEIPIPENVLTLQDVEHPTKGLLTRYTELRTLYVENVKQQELLKSQLLVKMNEVERLKDVLK